MANPVPVSYTSPVEKVGGALTVTSLEPAQ